MEPERDLFAKLGRSDTMAKKKKPPVMLASMLVLVLAIVAMLGIFNRPIDPEEAEKEAQRELQRQNVAQQGKERETPTKDLMMQSIKMTEDKVVAMKPAGGPEGEESEISPTPTIFLPSPADYKPTPNDGSVSTHWYVEGSLSSKK